ncbi:helix-turn-helix domain-containing protein [uncultured Roseobacter sp.]|uniref:helix-turn-helix domain-containing protein n=1 Tax=uncultured Roseobacter sp. TaxID=114847 RepID=UPI003451868A
MITSTNSVAEHYLTKSETAKLLSKSSQTLDRWHRLGTGPQRTRIGKTVLYRKDSLENWLQSQQQ